MKNDKRERILLTGATGFLGKHLSQRLASHDADLCLTALHDDEDANIEGMDLTKIDKVRKKIAEFKPTVIFHLGALVNLSRNFETGLKCIDVNLKGTYNLLESLRDNKPERFIFLSTEEIYGKGNLPFKENQVVDPPSAYAVTKIAAEQLAAIYASELNFSVEILRVGTMYGPFDFAGRLIPQIIIKALKNEPILLNSGLKKRDYIYVEDVVDALTAASEKKLPEQVLKINLGGGKSFRLKEVVEMILNETKSKSQVVYGAVEDRLGESDEWLLDNRNAEKFLGWKPKTSMSTGVRLTVDYYREKMKRPL